MSAYRRIKAAGTRGKILAAGLIFAGLLAQIGCTRDDVAAVIASVAVQLEATLVPWGATAVADAQTLETRIPEALATAKAPVPTLPITQTEPPRQIDTPVPTFTSSPPPADTNTPTAAPTETSLPTDTPAPTETPTPTPYPDIIVVPGTWMTLIPGGLFHMGAHADTLVEECAAFREGCLPEWFAASEPVHSVSLERYYIDAHEVTNEAYVSFLNADDDEPACLEQPCLDIEESPIVEQDGAFTVAEELLNHPATGVTWYGAVAYCSWRGARLPTEAEWERAAAWDHDAGIALRYPWGNTFVGTNVNYCDASCDAPQADGNVTDGYSETAPVASIEGGLSPSGIYDMAGNVWEWVGDWYDPDYYAQSPETDPAGPVEGEEKVVRGGSWFDTGNFTAAAIRFPSAPDNSDKTIGFRCAAPLP